MGGFRGVLNWRISFLNRGIWEGGREGDVPFYLQMQTPLMAASPFVFLKY